jgi:molybdenum cofactor cytidylyltransferase
VTKIAAIVLAAGASTRLGMPKQLIRCGPQTFLRHAATAALGSRASTTLVVLGSNAELMRRDLSGVSVHLVHNPQWPEGVGTSIRAGISWLLRHDPDCDGAVLMVCDQPYVSSQVIDRLIATFSSSGKQIVASAYAETLGVPALFSRDVFGELLKLAPGEGAKGLINEKREAVAELPFAEGCIDLDTPDDYNDWQHSFSRVPVSAHPAV